MKAETSKKGVFTQAKAEAEGATEIEELLRAAFPPGETWQGRKLKQLEKLARSDVEGVSEAAQSAIALLAGLEGKDCERAFEAGFQMAVAVARMADRDALHGHKAAKAAKGPRTRNETPLQKTVLDAWADYLDENPKGIKAQFFQWLRTEGDLYNLYVDAETVALKGTDLTAKTDTVSRWIKK